MVARTLPDWLPAGWTEQVNVKNNRKIKCYVDPLTGRKFYSKPQVSDYLRTLKHNSSASQQKKKGTVSLNVVEFNGDKTTLEPKGLQLCTRSSSNNIETGSSKESVNHNTCELTGGKTSLEEEEPHNVKNLKRTSYKSKLMHTVSGMQPAQEDFQLLASDVGENVAEMSPNWLPAGWTEHVKENNGRKVKCYVDPLTGRKFYSKPQVIEYLKTVKHNNSASGNKKKGAISVSNPIMCELTGGPTTLNLERSQSRTRSSSKHIGIGFRNESVEKQKMDELAGGKTSLKEESQNVKTPKQTSRKSERKQEGSIQPVNKVIIERVTADGLPPGWRKEIKIQKKANGTRKDPYYTDPVSGYVFFSQKDALRYIETGDLNSCSMKPKKRNELEFLDEETLDKMGELSGGTDSQKLKGSQKVKISERRSRTSKPKQMGSTEQPAEKVMIETVALDGLPPGWLQEMCYTDPVSGYVFFSREDALHYVETGDFDNCIIKPKKRGELGFFSEDTSPNMSKLSGVTNSMKQEGSEKKITPKRTRCISKQKEMGFSKQSVEKPNMSKLSGVKNSMKQEGPEKKITLKRTRCISKQKEMGFSKQSVEKIANFQPNVVEITGDQTSLEKEGSQKVKTPKRASRLSKQKINGHGKQSDEKEMIERVSPDGLPPGWIKEIRIQKKANGSRKDTYYTDPVSEYVFWSQKDALRYVEAGDINKCSIKPKKRAELGFLNGVSSVILPSVAVTQKSGHHTPKRRLFAGTQNSNARSLETTDGEGARKRRRISKGKLSPGNAIKEGADTKESYDASSSVTSITKGSNQKRSKRVGTENETVSKSKGKSTSSKEKNKSNKKAKIDSNKSKRKKALPVPSRSSARLVGPNSEIVKPCETEYVSSVGPHDDSSPHQFQPVSETQISDYSFKAPEAQPNAELSNTSTKNPSEDQAVPEDQPARDETVKTNVENQDVENPFGDSWSDPCLEFAFKTLSGEMPVEDNFPTHGNFQEQSENLGNFQEQSENPNPQAGGRLALLDFGISNFYQNDNVLSNIDAPEKPASDSGPISPTFLAPGNVHSLFFDSTAKAVSDSVPQLPNSPLFLASGNASSPTFDAPAKHVADSVPHFPNSSFLASGNVSSQVFDAPAKHVEDSVPHLPLFLASGNVSSQVFDAPAKHVANSVPQLPNSSLFLASGNVSSQVFDAPWKPESDSAPQMSTTNTFPAFGNLNSPNYSASAPQQPNLEENKEHQSNPYRG